MRRMDGWRLPCEWQRTGGVLVLVALVVLAAPTRAQITIPGADGFDGAFNPTVNIQVDLSQAPTGEWNGPNQNPGKSVYDPEKWAVDSGQAVPVDPRASLTSPLADVTVSSPSPLPLIIEAHNVPLDWNVVARVTVKVGQDFNVPATLIGGNQTLSTWQADITLPSAWSAIQVRAAMP